MKEKGALRSMKTQRGLLALMVLLFVSALFVGVAGAAEELEVKYNNVKIPVGAVTIPADSEFEMQIDLNGMKTTASKTFDVQVVGSNGKPIELTITSFNVNITTNNGKYTLSTINVGGNPVYDGFGFPYEASAPITVSGTLPADVKDVQIKFKGTPKKNVNVATATVKISVGDAANYDGATLKVTSSAFNLDKVIKEYKEVDPITPDIPDLQPSKDTSSGKTTIVIPAEADVTVKNNEVVIKDTTNGVTMTVTYNEPVSETPSGEVTGEVNNVAANYGNKPAEAAPSVQGTATISIVINLDEITTVLPEIDFDFKQEIVETVVKTNMFHKPLAMVSAESTVNEQTNSIELTFTIPATGLSLTGGKVKVLHIENGKVVGELKPDDFSKKGDKYIVKATGKKFSSYVVVEDTTPVTPSTPSGSSTWLTETPTPTETVTPTETPTPTDTAPTDLPTDVPTDVPGTPGFGVLAVLAGLGAVVALRRK